MLRHALDIFAANVDQIAESTHIRDVPRRWPIHDFLDETRIGSTAILVNDVPEKLDLIDEKAAFLQIENHAMGLQRFQDQFDVLFVLFLSSAIDEDVVEIDDAELIDKLVEDLVHTTLESTWRVR